MPEAQSENRKIQQRQHRTGVTFLTLLGAAAIFCLLMFVLIKVAQNVTYTQSAAAIELLNADDAAEAAADAKANHTAGSAGPAAGTLKQTEAGSTPRTLLLWEDEANGIQACELMDDVLSQTKADYDKCELNSFQSDMLAYYDKLVLAVTNYQNLGESLNAIRTWVAEGGNLMVLYPPSGNGSFHSISDVLGIQDISTRMTTIYAVRFTSGYMIGCEGKSFEITEPFQSSLSLTLKNDCEVFVESDDEYPTPLVWRCHYGEGTAVVNNLNIMGKAYRGLHYATYTLLDDYCVYPVINGAAFYIDDFPSPVPSGNGTYITRDYGLSIRNFYTSVWWPDLYNLAEKYGIKYTGLVIEDYSAQVEGEFARNTDIERYTYFGNLLLDLGGEIGLHGYNHMPLVPEGFDYMGLFDSVYDKWPTEDDMENALTELEDFCSELFPDESFQVYVPPSNILSDEGREALLTACPDIKAIAAVYLPGDLIYEQEFDVADDGIVNTPRIISGYMLDEFDELTAFCELNYHFVSSHFQHPDDVLDEDRGAEMGWEAMFGNLEDYTEWLYGSAPALRSLTGTEMAAAVQRYACTDFVTEETADGLHLTLTNFEDEAWFLIRINTSDGIKDIRGGEYSEAADGLYLIHATSDDVTITLK